MRFVEFQIPGPPVAWHRPGQAKGRRYKNADDEKYQKVVRLASISSLTRYLTDNPGARWSREGTFAVTIKARVPDLKRRDVDNLAKNIMDGLTGALYDDDAQVVSMNVEKRLDRSEPKVTVSVWEVFGYLDEHEQETLRTFPAVKG